MVEYSPCRSSKLTSSNNSCPDLALKERKTCAVSQMIMYNLSTVVCLPVKVARSQRIIVSSDKLDVFVVCTSITLVRSVI